MSDYNKKDAAFTDQKPEESFTPNPIYDEPAQLIHTRMSAVMTDIGSIGKDQKNKQQGFQYRGIDDVYNALHRSMAAHCVYTTSKILNEDREERQSRSGSTLFYVRLRMRYYFHTIDGSHVNTEVIGEAMDSGDKASNKAMAIAHKYALLQAFMVPTVEQKDPDTETYEVDTRENTRSPLELINACKTLSQLQATWKLITPEQRKQFASAKDVRKNEILADQAEKEEARL